MKTVGGLENTGSARDTEKVAREHIDRAYLEFVRAWKALGAEEIARRLDGFAVDFAYSSGKIENDSITYHDTRDVFEKGRVASFTGDVRTLFEIQNLKTSWEWALELAKPGFLLDEELILTAHLLLTYGTYDEHRWAGGERPGTYKKGEYVVGANAVGSFPTDVPADVAELLAEVNETLGSKMVRKAQDSAQDSEARDLREEPDCSAAVEEFEPKRVRNALAVAAYLHAKLVDIHPFADGNGRTARLLMNMVLLSTGLPPVVISEKDRVSYYGALDAFHDSGELGPFIDFLKAQSLSTWVIREFDEGVSR